MNSLVSFDDIDIFILPSLFPVIHVALSLYAKTSFGASNSWSRVLAKFPKVLEPRIPVSVGSVTEVGHRWEIH